MKEYEVIVISKKKWLEWFVDSFDNAHILLSRYIKGWKLEDIKTLKDYFEIFGYLSISHILNKQQTKHLFDENGELFSIPENNKEILILWR